MINGDGITITGTQDAVGIYAITHSQVNLTGDLGVSMSSPGAIAMATQHYDGYAPSVIAADGKMDIVGSVLSRGGLIDLNFAPGSRWYGSAGSDNVNSGHLNVTLNNSDWLIATSSNVDNLQLNNARVDLSSATDSSTYTTLTVANLLSGSGDFTLRTKYCR